MRVLKLSVIVPVYNMEKYLRRCLDSIVSQRFCEYELLLIDDGSTDDSGKICDEYASKDVRIRVVHQKNSGVSAARNCGIHMAVGQYVAFIDADDTIAPQYFEKLLSEMEEGGMVICPFPQDSKVKSAIRLSKAEAQVSVFTSAGIEGFPFCKLFCRKLLLEHKIFFDEDIAVCEDILFAVQYIKYTTAAIVVVPPCGYYYRENPNGALNGRFDKRYFRPKYLTEYEALCRAEAYIMNSQQVKEAWELRKAKAAVTCLRVMISANHEDSALYKILHAEAKKHWLKYLFAEQVALSAKVSIVLSAISPRLEYNIWKMTV